MAKFISRFLLNVIAFIKRKTFLFISVYMCVCAVFVKWKKTKFNQQTLQISVYILAICSASNLEQNERKKNVFYTEYWMIWCFIYVWWISRCNLSLLHPFAVFNIRFPWKDSKKKFVVFHIPVRLHYTVGRKFHIFFNIHIAALTHTLIWINFRSLENEWMRGWERKIHVERERERKH